MPYTQREYECLYTNAGGNQNHCDACGEYYLPGGSGVYGIGGTVCLDYEDWLPEWRDDIESISSSGTMTDHHATIGGGTCAGLFDFMNSYYYVSNSPSSGRCAGAPYYFDNPGFYADQNPNNVFFNSIACEGIGDNNSHCREIAIIDKNVCEVYPDVPCSDENGNPSPEKCAYHCSVTTDEVWSNCWTYNRSCVNADDPNNILTPIFNPEWLRIGGDQIGSHDFRCIDERVHISEKLGFANPYDMWCDPSPSVRDPWNFNGWEPWRICTKFCSQNSSENWCEKLNLYGNEYSHTDWPEDLEYPCDCTGNTLPEYCEYGNQSDSENSFGCTYSDACNYDSEADLDDGSCIYPVNCYNCPPPFADGACICDIDEDGICDSEDDCVGFYDQCGVCNGPGQSQCWNGQLVCNIDDCSDVELPSDDEIYGCTYPTACNYNQDATIDNQSCEYPVGICDCQGQIPDGFCNCYGATNATECGSIYKDCYNNCECFNDTDSDGKCDEEDDCVGQLDECGVCNGNGIPEGDCDCNGNTLDECNICGGTGANIQCWNGSMVCNIDDCPIIIDEEDDDSGQPFPIPDTDKGKDVLEHVPDNDQPFTEEDHTTDPIYGGTCECDRVSDVDTQGLECRQTEDSCHRGFKAVCDKNQYSGNPELGVIGTKCHCNCKPAQVYPRCPIPCESFDCTNCIPGLPDGIQPWLDPQGQWYNRLCCQTCCPDATYGCTDPNACNYDSRVNYDDGSCWYAQHPCECPDGPLARPDCYGVCNGNNQIDDCGVCACNTHSGGPNSLLECGGNLYSFNYAMDCSGVCFGDDYSCHFPDTLKDYWDWMLEDGQCGHMEWMELQSFILNLQEDPPPECEHYLSQYHVHTWWELLELSFCPDATECGNCCDHDGGHGFFDESMCCDQACLLEYCDWESYCDISENWIAANNACSTYNSEGGFICIENNLPCGNYNHNGTDESCITEGQCDGCDYDEYTFNGQTCNQYISLGGQICTENNQSCGSYFHNGGATACQSTNLACSDYITNQGGDGNACTNYYDTCTEYNCEPDGYLPPEWACSQYNEGSDGVACIASDVCNEDVGGTDACCPCGASQCCADNVTCGDIQCHPASEHCDPAANGGQTCCTDDGSGNTCYTANCDAGIASCSDYGDYMLSTSCGGAEGAWCVNGDCTNPTACPTDSTTTFEQCETSSTWVWNPGQNGYYTSCTGSTEGNLTACGACPANNYCFPDDYIDIDSCACTTSTGLQTCCNNAIPGTFTCEQVGCYTSNESGCPSGCDTCNHQCYEPNCENSCWSYDGSDYGSLSDACAAMYSHTIDCGSGGVCCNEYCDACDPSLVQNCLNNCFVSDGACGDNGWVYDPANNGWILCAGSCCPSGSECYNPADYTLCTATDNGISDCYFDNCNDSCFASDGACGDNGWVYQPSEINGWFDIPDAYCESAGYNCSITAYCDNLDAAYGDCDLACLEGGTFNWPADSGNNFTAGSGSAENWAYANTTLIYSTDCVCGNGTTECCTTDDSYCSYEAECLTYDPNGGTDYIFMLKTDCAYDDQSDCTSYCDANYAYQYQSDCTTYCDTTHCPLIGTDDFTFLETFYLDDTDTVYDDGTTEWENLDDWLLAKINLNTYLSLTLSDWLTDFYDGTAFGDYNDLDAWLASQDDVLTVLDSVYNLVVADNCTVGWCEEQYTLSPTTDLSPGLSIGGGYNVTSPTVGRNYISIPFEPKFRYYLENPTTTCNLFTILENSYYDETGSSAQSFCDAGVGGCNGTSDSIIVFAGENNYNSSIINIPGICSTFGATAPCWSNQSNFYNYSTNTNILGFGAALQLNVVKPGVIRWTLPDDCPGVEE